MKNYRLLLLIPFMALGACSSQKEISLEKAKEIAAKISAYESTDSFIFTLSNQGEVGKGDSKYSVDLSYRYVYTSKGYYTYIKGNNADQQFDAELYCVSNTRHGDVKFVRYYNVEKKEYVKAVSTSKYNSDYETAFTDYGVYRSVSAYNYYRQVRVLDVEISKGDIDKYYSSKDGELTIKYKTNIDYMTEDDVEWTTGGTETYIYKDYRFVSADGDTSSNYGNKWITKGSSEYKEDLKVDLPEDWENYLKLEA